MTNIQTGIEDMAYRMIEHTVSTTKVTLTRPKEPKRPEMAVSHHHHSQENSTPWKI